LLLVMPLRCRQHGCGGEVIALFLGMGRLPKIGRMRLWPQNLVIVELVRFFNYLFFS
jgi:hypothetical protein